MHLSWLDIIVVLSYAVCVLAMNQLLANSRQGRRREVDDYKPERRNLMWWAIGASLITANISAEQIIGMSGSAYALGLAIASYEWMGAATLLLVGKFILPIFVKNEIPSMPEFMRRRYGRRMQLVIAILWIGVYVFVAITAILWLGAVAVHAVTGLALWVSLILLGLFAGNYALYAGLKSHPLNDLIQVVMLVVGGLIIGYFALEKVSGGSGIPGLILGFEDLVARVPNHFHLILLPDNPYYKYVPGISVLVGGMWIANLSYFGFNQHIIQHALTANKIGDVQKGVVFAAILKLLVPVLIVLPGLAAAVLLPHLSRPDEAYPKLMTLLPNGLLGLVFIALVTAIIGSLRSTLGSVATIFTIDVFNVINKDAGKRSLVIVKRFVVIVALAVAMAAAAPLLGRVDQAFQYIQEYSGFFTPGVVAVFLLGILWKRATENGALVAAVGSPVLSAGFALLCPGVPFMNRMGYVFIIVLASAVIVSEVQKARPKTLAINLSDVDFSTDSKFNIGALTVVSILIAIYAVWW